LYCESLNPEPSIILSYLVLARKSRPQVFAEVVGQHAIVRTLQNGLRQGRIPHALIFSGVRGTGKTTLARIMAKALNCEKGPAEEPCGTCQSCIDIAAGNSVDLHEVDGASNRGIQEIRELKENIRFMPTSSRYKIIIIDEVHMLTTEAFNALLKTLEEPPEHVYFMFATTELHKVPVTILSRCQRYELTRVARDELFAHFGSLAGQEGVTIDDAALHLVVREAGGSVRDGLSLLDQIFSYCGNNVSGDDVAEVLGLVSHQVIADLANALLAGDLATSLARLDEVYTYGMDLKRFINELLTWFRGLVICNVSRQPQNLLDLPADEFQALEQAAAAYSSEHVSMMFHLLMDGLEKATFSARPRFAVEMVFIKAAQADSVVPVTTLLSRLDEALSGVTLSTPHATPAARTTNHERSRRTEAVTEFNIKNVEFSDPPQPVQPVAAAVVNEEQPPASPGAAKQLHPASSQPTKKEPKVEQTPTQQIDAVPPVVVEEPPHPAEEHERSLPSSRPSQLSQPEPDEPLPGADKEKTEVNAVKTGIPKKDIRKDWQEFIEYVRERATWMAATLSLASSTVLEKGQLIISFDDSMECQIFKDRKKLIPLTEFAMDFFQENLEVKFKVPNADGCETDPGSAAALQKERQSLARDPLVLDACNVFSGQVGDIRVGSRFRKPLQQEADITKKCNRSPREL